MKEDKFEELLHSLDGWDCTELSPGHEKRFEAKLKKFNARTTRSRIITLWQPLAAAAAIVIALGILFVSKPEPYNEFKIASVQTREADSVFNSMISVELNKLKKMQNPANKALIEDACKQLDAMEADYQSIRRDLVSKGESEQAIHALITNLQTRISFLQHVLEQIKNTKNSNTFKDENI